MSTTVREKKSEGKTKESDQLQKKHRLVDCHNQSPNAISRVLWYPLSSTLDLLHNLYLITLDDSPTFVIPNTVFGMAAAATSCLLTTTESNTATLRVLSWFNFAIVLVKTISFNWVNLLIFDLANQRQAHDEDKLNKPWRPIPSGRMTETRMRHWLMATIPLVLVYNYFYLDTGTEGCILAILAWIYNDLGGGDDSWVLRNLIIASAFSIYNLGSMKVAASSADFLARKSYAVSDVTLGISNLGYIWAFLISSVIFTTMHVQDLKDVVGDRARARRSAPIVLGRRIASYTIAVPVLVWSIVCAWFWAASIWTGIGTCSLGLVIALRCINLDDKTADRRTWQMWCGWTAVLYLLPLSAHTSS